MRSSIYILFISLLASGCGTRQPAPATGGQGVAEVRADVGPAAQDVTRVTVEAAGLSQELVVNPADGSFGGAFLLPAGAQVLVAHAFAGAMEIGASHPAPVDVGNGIVTRVQLRILDTRNPAPVYGPILDSLVHPTSVAAGASATFMISVVHPTGDPIAYRWTSSCSGATFSAGTSATTGWSNATPGTCQVSVTATADGLSIDQAFTIVVFPSAAGTGAIDATGVFVAAPVLHIDLPRVSCAVSPGENSSCPAAIASPDTTTYQISVISWGVSAPGTLVVSDSCGGDFVPDSVSTDALSGTWVPPIAGHLCVLTASASNGDGVTAQLTAAVLVHTGVPPVAQRTAPSPRSVAVADLNGDGHADIVTANNNGSSASAVSVLLGGGDGGFRPRFDVTAGLIPLAVAIADVNRDGKPDLLVVSNGNAAVSVLLGRGDGTFLPRTLVPTGASPGALAVADVNGDGNPDLLVNANSVVSVLLGLGDGTFPARADFPNGLGGAISIAVADLNGDGKLDLAVPNLTQRTVSILLGRGDGTFPTRTSFPSGDTPTSIAAADVNGDGKPDLIVTNQAPRTMSVFLGVGNGTFQPQVDYPTGALPVFVVVADVTADGKPDLLVANSRDNTVSVFPGRGDGTFPTSVAVPTGAQPLSIAVAEVNGDSRLDIITANTADSTVSVLLGKGGGTF